MAATTVDLSFVEMAKLLVPIITATGGTVVAAVKVGLNGSKKKIDDMSTTVGELRKEVGGVNERLIKVETKVDLALLPPTRAVARKAAVGSAR